MYVYRHIVLLDMKVCSSDAYGGFACLMNWCGFGPSNVHVLAGWFVWICYCPLLMRTAVLVAF